MSHSAAASATAMPHPAWLMGPYGLTLSETTTPEGSSSSMTTTPQQGVHNLNVAVNHELASPTEEAVVLDPLQEDAVVDIHRRWQRDQAQAMLLATCCCTRPLPHTPDYTQEDASDDATFAHGAWSEPDCTIYTRTRLRARERARRFKQRMAFFEDGTGFEQFGVIVVPNAYPQARVRELDFPCSIFTRTRSRTQRAAVPRSFPSCPSPVRRQRRS